MPIPLPPPPPQAFAIFRLGETPPARGGALAIGNFDGVHLGHKAVVARARDLAGDGPVTVLTFDPHPRAFFAPASAPKRIVGEAEKARLLAHAGATALAVARFDAALAAMPAERFVEEIVRDWLGAGHVVVGEDFRFGAGRKGDVALLRAMGARLGFRVAPAPTVTLDGERVSSSAVRQALAGGESRRANALLGHVFFVAGEVIHGEKRGRDLGYPTANLKLDPDTPLAHGIYAVRMRVDGVWRDGVASFGRRPTFDDGAPLLEVHLFDFTGDLYGKTVDVALVEWQRAEIKFDGIEALIAQMDADSARARRTLAGG